MTPANSPLTYAFMHTHTEQNVLETETAALAAKPGMVIPASNSTTGKAEAG